MVIKAACNCTLLESIAMSRSSVSTAAPPRLLNRPEAADWLRISQRKLDELAASGKLRRIKIDSSVRFDPSDLRSFAESRKST